MTPQPPPSKLQTPQVAAGPVVRSWPLGTEMVLHLSRRASNSSRLYHPQVSISQARRLNTAGWETAGHRGGILFGMGCKPAELTKPLLPHPLLRLLRAHPPSPVSLPVPHWGQQGSLPIFSFQSLITPLPERFSPQ